MDGLRKLAVSTFENEQQFHIPPPQFQTVEVSAFPTQSTLLNINSEWEGDLVSHFARRPRSCGNEPAAATLKLVSIPRVDPYERICMSRPVFLKLFESSSIHRYCLYLISRNTYGFHHLNSSDNSSTETTYSFFLSTALYTLIWSFNPTTMATFAILIGRNNMATSVFNSGNFCKNLQLYQDHIYTPHLLSFVASVDNIGYTDWCLINGAREIREIEAQTGHGTWIVIGAKDELASDEITNMSKAIATILTKLANQFRHGDIASSLISFYMDEANFTWRDDFSSMHLPKHDSSAALFKSTAPTLRMQIQSGKAWIAYLQERARCQSSVVCFPPRFRLNYGITVLIFAAFRSHKSRGRHSQHLASQLEH
jgi:hypothetical protein